MDLQVLSLTLKLKTYNDFQNYNMHPEDLGLRAFCIPGACLLSTPQFRMSPSNAQLQYVYPQRPLLLWLNHRCASSPDRNT
jgi:hypothetical protein